MPAGAHDAAWHSLEREAASRRPLRRGDARAIELDPVVSGFDPHAQLPAAPSGADPIAPGVPSPGGRLGGAHGPTTFVAFDLR